MARRTIHTDPTNIPDDAPKSAVLMEFARRLQKGMNAKGWNQSELCRRASELMPPDGGTVDRALVSKYINSKALPGPVRLEAIAKALDMAPDELLPTRGITAASEKTPELDVRDVGDGRVWLRVNQAVDWAKALKIMAILKGENGG